MPVACIQTAESENRQWWLGVGLRVDIQLLRRAEATGAFTVEQLDIIAALTQEISAQHERRLDIPAQTDRFNTFSMDD